MRPALGVLLFSFFMAVVLALWPGGQHLARAGTVAVLEWGLRDPQRVVDAILPVWLGGEPDNPVEKAAGAFARVARADLGDPRRLVAAQVPVFRADQTAPRAVPARPSAIERAEPVKPVPEKPGSIEVGIYHTHTGETYEPTDGVERLDGEPGGVVEVGRVLKRVLEEKHGIGVVHSEKVHDVPYSRSYLESEETARRMVEEYPDLKLLLDIHRDSLTDRSRAVTEIDGEETATVLLVVGSDARQPFPDWPEHLALARRVAAQAQELYPGLCAGVRVKEGRYNQFVHPGALLVEVGGVANHTKEALRSAELLADVLASLLKNPDDRETAPPSP